MLQGQAGLDSEQPDLFGDVPAHSRGVGLEMTSKVPFQHKVFYISIILYLEVQK